MTPVDLRVPKSAQDPGHRDAKEEIGVGDRPRGGAEIAEQWKTLQQRCREEDVPDGNAKDMEDLAAGKEQEEEHAPHSPAQHWVAAVGLPHQGPNQETEVDDAQVHRRFPCIARHPTVDPFGPVCGQVIGMKREQPDEIRDVRIVSDLIDARIARSLGDHRDDQWR